MKNLGPLIYYSLALIGYLVAFFLGKVPWEVPAGIFAFGSGHMAPSPLKGAEPKERSVLEETEPTE